MTRSGCLCVPKVERTRKKGGAQCRSAGAMGHSNLTMLPPLSSLRAQASRDRLSEHFGGGCQMARGKRIIVLPSMTDSRPGLKVRNPKKK